MTRREVDVKDGKEMACAILNFVNSYDPQFAEFIEKMAHDHCTLQQSFTRLCLLWLEKLASGDVYVDGRNRASYDVAKKLLANWDEDWTASNLPMI